VYYSLIFIAEAARLLGDRREDMILWASGSTHDIPAVAVKLSGQQDQKDESRRSPIPIVTMTAAAQDCGGPLTPRRLYLHRAYIRVQPKEIVGSYVA
jgi:hypothetical protein